MRRGGRSKGSGSALSDQNESMAQRDFHTFKCLWDPQERDEVVAHEAAQMRKEGTHLGPSIEGERAREP